jgi:hypothetical protein
VGRGGGGKVLLHSSGPALCTAALLHCWTVGRGGDDVLLRSSGPEIAHAGREGKDGEHCNVHLHSSTAALLDEIMNMGGRRQRRCPPLFQWP